MEDGGLELDREADGDVRGRALASYFLSDGDHGSVSGRWDTTSSPHVRDRGIEEEGVVAAEFVAEQGSEIVKPDVAV